MKLLIILVSFATLATIASAENVICYFTSWTTYRPGNGKFDSSQVDPHMCTHIQYSFVGLGENGELNLLDDWEANGLHEINNIINMKQVNPNLKVLVSMGGWNEGSERYSNVSASASKRNNLVNNVISFLDRYPFDGFDLDWEYPNQRGGKPADVKNYVTLLSQLKSALSARGKLFTIAVACGIASSDLSYDFQGVANNVDMIDLMCYDYHGSFENVVGHYAPLHGSHLDKTQAQKQLNVADSVQYWLDKGVDRKKINLGLGTYGRGFRLANSNNAKLYSPAIGGSAQGPYTRQDGIIGYNEICELYSNWPRTWDDEQKVPHIVNGDQWIGYDDVESITAKVRFGRSLQLGGFMIWSLDTDDFRGLCGQGKYPLVNAIKRA